MQSREFTIPATNDVPLGRIMQPTANSAPAPQNYSHWQNQQAVLYSPGRLMHPFITHADHSNGFPATPLTSVIPVVEDTQVHIVEKGVLCVTHRIRVRIMT